MSEHTQVGPYALGLLDPLEMSRFEEHLADCDECATQLEWMLPVADLMADVEPGDLYGIDGPSAFSTPGGSVQQSMTMTDPTTRAMPQAQPPGPAPPSYPPLRDLQTPNYPNEFPGADPRTGSMPTVDPRTGSIPTVDPRTGGMPTADPRTGSIPATGPRTGSLPAASSRTGGIPRVDPRTGSVPRADSRSEMPRAEPATGENRIVPLVRGGDSRRRTQSRQVPNRPAEMSAPGRQRTGLLIAAAAAVLGAAVGAGAMVAGPWANDGSNGTAPVFAATPEAPVEKLRARDAESGVQANVALQSKPWGTLVSFTVKDIDGPRKCRLVAVLPDGKDEVLSTWTVPEQGYTEGTEPPELTLMAATSLTRKEIAAFRVQDITDEGNAGTLVTVRS
jgi:hypothetical protein